MGARENAGMQGAASGAATGTAICPGWGTAIGAVVGGLAGYFGASEGDDDYAKRQEKLAQEDINFRKELFDYEKNLTGPVRERLRNEYLSGQSLDYAENAAQINKNFDDISKRDLVLNYGKTSAGQSGNDLQARLLERAKALGEVYAGGLKANRSLGLALAGQDQSLQAGMNVSRGNENLENIYGHQADVYNLANKQMWDNMGRSVASIAYGYGNRDRNRTPDVSENTPVDYPTNDTPSWMMQQPGPTPGWDVPPPPGYDNAGQPIGS
jgi:hypothetical protein